MRHSKVLKGDFFFSGASPLLLAGLVILFYGGEFFGIPNVDDPLQSCRIRLEGLWQSRKVSFDVLGKSWRELCFVRCLSRERREILATRVIMWARIQRLPWVCSRARTKNCGRAR